MRDFECGQVQEISFLCDDLFYNTKRGTCFKYMDIVVEHLFMAFRMDDHQIVADFRNNPINPALHAFPQGEESESAGTCLKSDDDFECFSHLGLPVE